jgi:hypothetical protein
MRRKEFYDTIDYILGSYIGEYIVNDFLVTLSTDLIRTKNVIQVSAEDTAKLKALNDAWFPVALKDKTIGNTESKDEWEAMQEFYQYLAKKYLPEELVIKLPFPDVHHIDHVKEAIRDVLWDCDCCSYCIEKNEDIVIEHEYGTGVGFIRLKRSVKS